MRALRHEYERRIADTTRPPADRSECAGWLAVCKPLQLNAINATLRSQCYSARLTPLFGPALVNGAILYPRFLCSRATA